MRLDLLTARTVAGGPCSAVVFLTPGGELPVESYAQALPGTWLRTTGSWQQLVTDVDGTWIGATAGSGEARSLLQQALANARPMTDDEYDDWLDEVL